MAVLATESGTPHNCGMTAKPRITAPSPVSPERSSTRNQRGVLLGVAIVGLVLAVTHWPVLSAEALSFDDSIYLFENPSFRQPGWEPIGEFFGQVLHSPTVEGYYEPLTLTSLMLDVMAGGRADHLQPFHRTSLALHVVNTMLIILLLYGLFGYTWAAVITGLLFGLHPLTVEPVSWVWERKTLLATFFVLISLIVYVRYAANQEGEMRRGGEGAKKIRTPHSAFRTWSWYVASIICFVLALLSKPTSVPLPVLLLLLDWWPLGRLGRRSLIEKIPFFAVAALFAIITIISTKQNSGVILPSAAAPMAVVGRICYLLVFYLRKIVWPVNLSSSYAAPASFSFSEPAILASVIVLGLIAAAMLISLRRTRAFVAGALFFLVAIAPTLGIIGYSWVIASDKYVYLPAVGLSLVFCFVISQLWSRQRAAVIVCVVLLAGAEAMGTRQYLGQWTNTQTLLTYMQRLNPDAPAVLNQLGNVLSDQGKSGEAAELYLRALRIEPRLYSAYYNLGLELARQGKMNEAIDCFQKSLQLKPNFAKAHVNAAVLLANRGETESAIAHLQEALKYEPGSPRSHNNLANILAQRNQTAEAELHYREALRLDPDYAEAHSNLAVLLAAQGDLEEAQKHYEAALRVQPGFAEGHNNLGLLLMQTHRVDDAIRHYATAIQIRPNYVDARMNLASALQTIGRSAEVIKQCREVLRIQPDYPGAKALLEQLATSRPTTSRAG